MLVHARNMKKELEFLKLNLQWLWDYTARIWRVGKPPSKFPTLQSSSSRHKAGENVQN